MQCNLMRWGATCVYIYIYIHTVVSSNPTKPNGCMHMSHDMITYLWVLSDEAMKLQLLQDPKTRISNVQKRRLILKIEIMYSPPLNNNTKNGCFNWMIKKTLPGMFGCFTKHPLKKMVGLTHFHSSRSFFCLGVGGVFGTVCFGGTDAQARYDGSCNGNG